LAETRILIQGEALLDGTKNGFALAARHYTSHAQDCRLSLGIEYCVERERPQNASWENLITELKDRFRKFDFQIWDYSFSKS